MSAVWLRRCQTDPLRLSNLTQVTSLTYGLKSMPHLAYVNCAFFAFGKSTNFTVGMTITSPFPSWCLKFLTMLAHTLSLIIRSSFSMSNRSVLPLLQEFLGKNYRFFFIFQQIFRLSLTATYARKEGALRFHVTD